jgi:transcriptional regulator with XRE-family HTH domain
MRYWEDMARSFGENLETLMREKRFSVSVIAKELSMPAKTVHEWVGKDGRMPRNPDVLKRLADLLNVTVYFLLYGEEDPRSPLNHFLEKTEIHTGMYEITIKKVNSKSK